jgi:uncharacterized protein (DUF2141 family)
MKYRLLCFLLVVTISGLAQGRNQTVMVGNLDNKKGKLYIGWYGKAGDFRKADKAVFKQVAEVNGKETTPVLFENIPPGTYAIAIFLDENGNGKIDTNLFGIPKEKYGFSNNVYPMMRAASFSEAAFTITDKEETITIRLK